MINTLINIGIACAILGIIIALCGSIFLIRKTNKLKKNYEYS